MIIYEEYGKNKKGINLTRVYSDKDFYIKRDDQLYIDAIDPTELHREYTETDIKIDEEEEAGIEDYEDALREVGVEV